MSKNTKSNSFGNIAAIVKSHRERKGISQVRLSKMLGYKNGQFVSNVERGLCSFPLKRIRSLQKILEIPKVDLKWALISDHESKVERFL